jgi:hypothetical protein
MQLLNGDDQMKTKIDMRRIIRNSVRLYFAPLTGIYKEVRCELRRISREQYSA